MLDALRKICLLQLWAIIFSLKKNTSISVVEILSIQSNIYLADTMDFFTCEFNVFSSLIFLHKTIFLACKAN